MSSDQNLSSQPEGSSSPEPSSTSRDGSAAAINNPVLDQPTTNGNHARTPNLVPASSLRTPTPTAHPHRRGSSYPTNGGGLMTEDTNANELSRVPGSDTSELTHNYWAVRATIVEILIFQGFPEIEINRFENGAISLYQLIVTNATFFRQLQDVLQDRDIPEAPLVSNTLAVLDQLAAIRTTIRQLEDQGTVTQ